MSEFEKSEKMEKEKIGKETALVSPFGCRTGKNTYLRMLVFAIFMLAAVGFLSSCATSSKSKAPEDDTTTMPPPTTTPDPTPPVVVTPESPGPYEVLVQGQNKAKDANDKAEMALKDAEKFSKMISAGETDGDSMMAMANAQKVFDTRGMIEMYLMNAKDAKDELVTAKKDADEAAMAALNKVIMEEIDGYIKTIQGILDDQGSGSLDAFITAVKGTDSKKPKTASDIGQEVAKSIFNALKPPETGTVPVGLDNHATAATQTEVDMATMKTDNHTGKNWEEIVGSSNVMEGMRIVEGDGTKVVKAASVDGDSVTAHTTSGGDGALPTSTCSDAGMGDCADGMQYNAQWMGIDGKIFCQGKNCGLTVVVDNPFALTGSWYFTPDSMTYYLRNDRTYVKEVYAEYGYWLDESDDATDLVHTFSHVVNEPNTPIPGSWVTVADLEAKATYSGNAIGLYSKFSGDNYQSGHFSADVELEATFGDSADQRLDGTIDNFRDANNNMIDSGWSVELDAATPSDGAVTAGVITHRSGNGAWTANSIGIDADSRPHTIHGTFNAHLVNGDVAGAYATRKK